MWLPLLPISSLVYWPGHSCEFEISPRDCYPKLFDYAASRTHNTLALAYPVDPHRPDGKLFSAVSVIHMEVCEPVVRKGELWSYSIETLGARRARIEEERWEDGFRIASLRYCPYKESRLDSQKAVDLILPLWLQARLLVGGRDDLNSIVPSPYSEHFGDYLGNVQSFIDRLLLYLPLTYRHKVNYLECDNIGERAAILRRMMRELAHTDFSVEVARLRYEHLRQKFPRFSVGSN